MHSYEDPYDGVLSHERVWTNEIKLTIDKVQMAQHVNDEKFELTKRFSTFNSTL